LGKAEIFGGTAYLEGQGLVPAIPFQEGLGIFRAHLLGKKGRKGLERPCLVGRFPFQIIFLNRGLK